MSISKEHTIVFCFSGQGSHFYHMGKELYEKESAFRTWMNTLDEIVRPFLGQSVLSVLYDTNKKPGDNFSRTCFTHPAIFMLEYSLFQVFAARNIVPDYVFGASLGEFTSAAVSGVVDYENAMKMVVKQALVIESACEPGGMMAFLHQSDYFHELNALFPDIELSALNSDNHFVISGTQASLAAIDRIAKSKDIFAQALPVSFAFHSRLIEPAADEYRTYLQSFTYKKPNISYLSSVTGEFIDNPAVFEGGYFWDVCREPILIKKASEYIESQGPFIYLDCGPFGTMANLIKQNIAASSTSRVQPTISPFGQDMAAITKAEKNIKNI
jgi:acyl transferase domain-containing protein